jgi:putative transposase
MDSSESLSHSRWECKYHVVFISKCRRKVLYERLQGHVESVAQAGRTGENVT